MRDLYYSRAGEPIPQEAALPLLGSVDERRVAGDDVVVWGEAELTVSTVHLVLDHNFGAGPPLIFETMVFPGADLWDRYSTEEAALAGHAECVDAVRAGTFPSLRAER